MTDAIKAAIAAAREIEAKARLAGCLPADNCVFHAPAWQCVFCGRESGKKPDGPYSEKWGAKDDAIAALKHAVDALEIAVEALRKHAVNNEGWYTEKHRHESEKALARIAALLPDGGKP